VRGLMLEMRQGQELEGLVLEWASRSVVGRGLVERRVEARGAMEAWRRVEEPAPHRSEDGPVHAERIRRSWEAGKCVAVGPVVRLGRVVGLGFVVGRAEFGAGGREGSGGCSCL
jgi:hypothetical protein